MSGFRPSVFCGPASEKKGRLLVPLGGRAHAASPLTKAKVEYGNRFYRPRFFLSKILRPIFTLV